jgi:hypothetical protein
MLYLDQEANHLDEDDIVVLVHNGNVVIGSVYGMSYANDMSTMIVNGPDGACYYLMSNLTSEKQTKYNNILILWTWGAKYWSMDPVPELYLERGVYTCRYT